MPKNTPFVVKPFADVGTGEPFMARLALGLSDVVDATTLSDKQLLKEAILGMVFDCITPAFMSLRELRNLTGRPDALELAKAKNFDDMYKSLWAAYKDRMQSVARMMGFDIGFLFQKDTLFEKGCSKFQIDHPAVDPAFVEMLKVYRSGWQRDLSRFRNDYLEHQKVTRQDMSLFYELTTAEAMFKDAWLAIEETLAALLSSRLVAGACLVEIPEDKRDPQFPKRFAFGWSGPPFGQ